MTDTQANKGLHGEEILAAQKRLVDYIFRWSLISEGHHVIQHLMITEIANLNNGNLKLTLTVPVFSALNYSSQVPNLEKQLKAAGLETAITELNYERKPAKQERVESKRVEIIVPDSTDSVNKFDHALRSAVHDSQVATMLTAFQSAAAQQQFASNLYPEGSGQKIDSLRDALSEAAMQPPLKSSLKLNAMQQPIPSGLSQTSHLGSIDIDAGKLR